MCDGQTELLFVLVGSLSVLFPFLVGIGYQICGDLRFQSHTGSRLGTAGVTGGGVLFFGLVNDGDEDVLQRKTQSLLLRDPFPFKSTPKSDFSGSSVVKNALDNAGDTGLIPGLRESHILRNN